MDFYKKEKLIFGKKNCAHLLNGFSGIENFLIWFYWQSNFINEKKKIKLIAYIKLNIIGKFCEACILMEKKDSNRHVRSYGKIKLTCQFWNNNVLITVR